MGLKCSVLGHAYGETTVERDREEQGSEVVITIREVETCDRCGNERVVSENKEVTSIETPDDEDEFDAAMDESAADDEADTPDGDAEADDAEDEAELSAAGEELSASEIVGGATDESSTEDASAAETESADEDTTTAPPEGSEPDTGAEIIDAESDEPVADDGVDEELADPTIDPEVEDSVADDPAAGDDGDDDAVIIDEDDESVETAGRQPGEWPEEPNAGEDEWKPDTIGSIEEDDEEEQATEATTLTVPDGQFRCPECDFTTAVDSSSLRRGDFCPDCRRGTLVHEPEDETRKG